MLELLIPLALVGTFGAILVGGMAVEAVLAERRRAVRVLEAQIAPNTTTDLREQDLSRSFLERVLVPVVSVMGTAARKITPADMRRRIARKLVLAGSPAGWDAEKIAAFKVFGVIGGGIMGVILGVAVGLSTALTTSAVVFLALFGYLLPGAGLGQRVIARQEAIRRALPDTIDLLTISVEAGLSFDAALSQVRRNVPGPLSQEIARTLQEMQIGVSRIDAFRHLADRTDVTELGGFILAMIQADIFGVSIAGVLRAQSKEMRTKRRQFAEERAQRVPVKLLLPLIFCILPAMFVVILGPGVIRFVENFLGIKL
jgi:tight adherence protein C